MLAATTSLKAFNYWPKIQTRYWRSCFRKVSTKTLQRWPVLYLTRWNLLPVCAQLSSNWKINFFRRSNISEGTPGRSWIISDQCDDRRPVAFWTLTPGIYTCRGIWRVWNQFHWRRASESSEILASSSGGKMAPSAPSFSRWLCS